MSQRSMIATGLGNIVEWYDFALFIYVSPIFATLFFPSADPSISFLASFGVFALGFICRPLGGILFGHFGDKRGRSKILRLSTLLITLPSLLISILPTYETIGIWAPALLIFLRLAQGIFIGGQYAGTAIYLAELAPQKKEALFTSIAPTGANLGLLLGIALVSVIAHILTPAEMASFGWRLCFLMGGLFSLLIFYWRRSFIETPAFLGVKGTGRVIKKPLMHVLKYYPRLMIHIICLVSFGACLFYTLFAYMSTYLIQYSTLSFQKITSIQTLLIVSMLILVPLFSLLCDKIGRRHMYFIFCGLGIISSYPAFILFQGGALILIISMLLWLTLISSMEQATTLITLVEITPPEIRYTILALASNIGYILFGGLTPLVLSGAIHLTHNHLMPAFYLMATACLSLLSSSLLKKRI